jgi:hypothetical protein
MRPNVLRLVGGTTSRPTRPPTEFDPNAALAALAEYFREHPLPPRLHLVPTDDNPTERTTP